MFATAHAADEIKPEITQALQDADTAQAIELLQAEIAIDKGYHANYFTLGMIYFERKQWDAAVEQFEIAVDKKSKHWDSKYHLGLAYLQLGRLDDAEKQMTEGRKKARNGEKGWFENGFGLVMLAREQYGEADKAFRAALVVEDNAEYHINLGDANYYQGIPALAIIEYEKALAVDTASTEVYYHWAEACLEMKDYNCAIEKLHVVLEKDSTYADAWMRAGGIYFRAARSTRTVADRKARFMDAIGSYNKYLELSGAVADTSNVRVFFELAMSYVSIGGSEDAATNFDAVLAIPYEARDIYFQYAKALWGMRDFVKSGEMLQKHIEWAAEAGDDANSKVDDDELYQYYGDAFFYREAKDYYQAAKYYEKSVEANPNQKRIVYNLAVSYHNLKDFGNALYYYQKRIDLGIDSTKAGVYKNAGYSALNIANKDNEEEELDEEEEEEEGVAPAVDDRIDPTLNYYEVAAQYIQQYLELVPGDTKAITLVANTYLYQLSDCTNGVKWYQQLLSVDPKNCDAMKALGYAYFGGVCTRNYTKALGYLRDAYTCVSGASGECGDADLVLWIAQCYHLRAVDKGQAKDDDFQNANKWYSRCLKCEPGNAECKKGRDDTSFEF